MIHHLKLKHLVPLLLLLLGCSEKNKLKKTLVEYHTTQSANYSQWENPAPLFLVEKDSIDIYLNFLKAVERQFMAIDTTKLEPSTYSIWQNELRLILEQQQRWESLFSAPAAFDVTRYFKNIIEGPGEVNEKLSKVSAALELVPKHFEKAKMMITAPAPNSSALAVQKQLLFLRFLQNDLPDLMKNANIEEQDRAELTARIRNAKLASKDFIGFCESLIFEHFDSTLIRPQQE